MERALSKGAVVVGVDGSPASADALRWACAEAERRGVDVVAVYAAPVMVPSEWTVSLPSPEPEGMALLERMIAESPTPMTTVHPVVRVAPPVQSIRAEALRNDACVMVVGRRGTGRLRRLVVGSVSAGLAHDPPCPLVVVPAGAAPPSAPGGTILTGVDGSAPSLAALRFAAEEAEHRGAVVEAVFAWALPHLSAVPLLSPNHDNVNAIHTVAKRALQREVAALPPALGTRVRPRLRKGDPTEVLLRMATRADLVVVGTRGQGFVHRHMLGSTSHALLAHCRVPLAIVPGTVAEEGSRIDLAAGEADVLTNV